MGGWTDKVGRRPALILPVVGSALDAGVVLIVIYAKLPIYCLFVGALIHGLCGYYTAILFACVSYIADTTEQGQIAFRLGKLSIRYKQSDFCFSRSNSVENYAKKNTL